MTGPHKYKQEPNPYLREACLAEGTMNERFSLCKDFWNLLGPNSLTISCPLLTNVWKQVRFLTSLWVERERKLRWLGLLEAGEALCGYFLSGVEKVVKSLQEAPGL